MAGGVNCKICGQPGKPWKNRKAPKLIYLLEWCHRHCETSRDLQGIWWSVASQTSQTPYLPNPFRCSSWRIWRLCLCKGWPVFHQELDHWQVACLRSHMQGIPAQVAGRGTWDVYSQYRTIQIQKGREKMIKDPTTSIFGSAPSFWWFCPSIFYLL